MKSLRKYIIRPAIILFLFIIVCIALGIKAPIVLVRLRYILTIAGVLLIIGHLAKKRYTKAIFYALIVILFSWMRRGETYFLQTKTTELDLGFSAKFVVLSDLHLGVYKGEGYVKKLVQAINAQTGVDAVFIVGDRVYDAPHGSLATILAPFKQVTYSMYGVLGNHDTMPLENNSKGELEKVLSNLGVTFLQNQKTTLQLSGRDIKIFGLGDERVGGADVSILSGIQQSDNVVVLAHDPDTIMRYGQIGTGENFEQHRHSFLHKSPYNTGWLATVPVDITFAGHTHASQIRFFGLTNNLTPTKYRWPHDGWYTELKLFITRGVGETIVPVRLMDRVQIDIIQSY